MILREINCLIKNNHQILLKHIRLKNSAAVSVEKISGVTAVAIDIPEKKNQLDFDAYNALCDALHQFERDDTSSAAVIYGVGGNFCTGCSDDFVPDLSKLIDVVKKPLVAGLTGYATGFGFELAVACDLRVMEDTAQLGLNAYPHKMSDITYKRLVSIAGMAFALDLAVTGRNVHLKEAALRGLIDRPVDCGTGIGQAIQLAKSIGKYPATLLRDAKAAVYISAHDVIK